MILFALTGLFPVLFGLSIEATDPQVVRRIVIRDEIIVRVPVRPRLNPRIEWKEHKGPKCIAIDRLAGSVLSGPSSIDFVFRDRSRVRAELDDECPAIDFYGGFYLQPEDHRICADREVIRSRVGASCEIDRFRRLTPRPRR